MALFKLPLSGDVVQWINPVTWFASGNQISTNVYPENQAHPRPRPKSSIGSARMDDSLGKSLMP
jgi:hypothetical protein